MRVTIKDIARLANVSTTTVSRVINNKDEGVGSETRKRIQQIIKDLNYKPSSLARGLVTKKTKSIGLVLPDITNPFFPDLARGVEDYSVNKGYNAFLCNSDNNGEKEKIYINALMEKHVDGLVITSTHNLEEKHILELMENKIPIVILDRRFKSKDLHGVYTDNFSGAYEAVRYLIQNGHKSIGCITGPLDTSISKERFEGYKKALKDNGIKYNDRFIVQSNFKIDGGIKASEELLKNKEITAIFACNDLMAYGVYKTARKLKLNVPEDISVIGFDDISLSQIVTPTLTTVSQPVYEMGYEAAKMLISLIEGKVLKRKVKKLSTKLVVRESTTKKGIQGDVKLD
ncbi:MAG: LacI family transcriptional regulator [Maledivibacter sp.]|nr:LacI family transcriptional regulator [Maledivibacter sp.]